MSALFKGSAHGFAVSLGAFVLPFLLGFCPAVARERPVVRPHIDAPVVHHALPRWHPGHPGWWRGHPDFDGYVGIRRGYYFAPGYGYYSVAPAYQGRIWTTGATLPMALRRYYVVSPGFYGLAVPPPGHAWIFANGSILLISRTTGVIIRRVPHIW